MKIALKACLYSASFAAASIAVISIVLGVTFFVSALAEMLGASREVAPLYGLASWLAIFCGCLGLGIALEEANDNASLADREARA